LISEGNLSSAKEWNPEENAYFYIRIQTTIIYLPPNSLGSGASKSSGGGKDKRRRVRGGLDEGGCVSNLSEKRSNAKESKKKVGAMS